MIGEGKMATNNEPWYGVKYVFLHKIQGENVYEERVILITASGDDEAIARGEVFAREYAEANNCRALDFASAFNVFGEEIGDGTEVYSLMRVSTLNPSDYLDHFYDNGGERSRSCE